MAPLRWLILVQYMKSEAQKVFRSSSAMSAWRATWTKMNFRPSKTHESNPYLPALEKWKWNPREYVVWMHGIERWSRRNKQNTAQQCRGNFHLRSLLSVIIDRRVSSYNTSEKPPTEELIGAAVALKQISFNLQAESAEIEKIEQDHAFTGRSWQLSVQCYPHLSQSK